MSTGFYGVVDGPLRRLRDDYDQLVILRPIVGLRDDSATPRVNVRCPACRREVTFDAFGSSDSVLTLSGPNYVRTGQRVCGNPECRAHLFIVAKNNTGEMIASYPPETLDFDASDIPGNVATAFEEAIKCHGQQCYVAAAIMVRKALEEICADRGARGPNLKARIEALGKSVVLPQALLDGLDDLRLLGNDAAHLESRVYEQIGKTELEVAIDVAKEILKATYQYEGLMSRLRALQRGEAER